MWLDHTLRKSNLKSMVRMGGCRVARIESKISGIFIIICCYRICPKGLEAQGPSYYNKIIFSQKIHGLCLIKILSFCAPMNNYLQPHAFEQFSLSAAVPCYGSLKNTIRKNLICVLKLFTHHTSGQDRALLYLVSWMYVLAGRKIC